MLFLVRRAIEFLRTHGENELAETLAKKFRCDLPGRVVIKTIEAGIITCEGCCMPTEGDFCVVFDKLRRETVEDGYLRLSACLQAEVH